MHLFVLTGPLNFLTAQIYNNPSPMLFVAPMPLREYFPQFVGKAER